MGRSEAVKRGVNTFHQNRFFRMTENITTLTELIDSNELDRALDLYKGPLLPNSEIPFVIEHRTHLETLLRIAVLESGMPALLARLATKFDDDLELVEEALKNYSEPSTTRTRLLAQRKRILKKWESD